MAQAHAYVDYILSNNVEKKALKLLATLRNIASKYSSEELEAGCHTLISVAKEPTNSLLKSILSRAKKRKKALNTDSKASIIEEQTDSKYGFVRGAAYFGGKK